MSDPSIECGIIRHNKRGHGIKQYFAQFLTHANRNLGLADEDGSVNIVCVTFQLVTSQWLKICVQSLKVIRHSILGSTIKHDHSDSVIA